MSGFDHHRRCQHLLYYLDCAEFDALMAYARGRCQFCRMLEADTTRGQLVIDHCPKYGWYAVRGLLCDKCNNLIDKVDTGKKYDARCWDYWRNSWFLSTLRVRHKERLASARPSVSS